MPSPPGRLACAAALGLFGCFIAVSLPPALVHSSKRIAQAVARRGEPPAAAFRRLRGGAYADALAPLLAAIPRDGAYLLVDATPAGAGGAYWLRFDLAPRRAILLGRLDELPGPAALAARLAALPALPVVVARGEHAPPLLLDRASLLAAIGGGR
jgi:hypothetical protein